MQVDPAARKQDPVSHTIIAVVTSTTDSLARGRDSGCLSEFAVPCRPILLVNKIDRYHRSHGKGGVVPRDDHTGTKNDSET